MYILIFILFSLKKNFSRENTWKFNSQREASRSEERSQIFYWKNPALSCAVAKKGASIFSTNYALEPTPVWKVRR